MVTSAISMERGGRSAEPLDVSVPLSAAVIALAEQPLEPESPILQENVSLPDGDADFLIESFANAPKVRRVEAKVPLVFYGLAHALREPHIRAWHRIAALDYTGQLSALLGQDISQNPLLPIPSAANIDELNKQRRRQVVKNITAARKNGADIADIVVAIDIKKLKKITVDDVLGVYEKVYEAFQAATRAFAKTAVAQQLTGTAPELSEVQLTEYITTAASSVEYDLVSISKLIEYKVPVPSEDLVKLFSISRHPGSIFDLDRAKKIVDNMGNFIGIPKDGNAQDLEQQSRRIMSEATATVRLAEWWLVLNTLLVRLARDWVAATHQEAFTETQRMFLRKLLSDPFIAPQVAPEPKRIPILPRLEVIPVLEQTDQKKVLQKSWTEIWAESKIEYELAAQLAFLQTVKPLALAKISQPGMRPALSPRQQRRLKAGADVKLSAAEWNQYQEAQEKYPVAVAKQAEVHEQFSAQIEKLQITLMEVRLARQTPPSDMTKFHAVWSGPASPPAPNPRSTHPDTR